MKISNKSASTLFIACWFVILAMAFLGGCSQLQVVTPDKPVNCLTFATEYSKESGGNLVIGLYRPVTSVYHAWLEIGGGMCIDQIRIFKCDDSRYKELACKDDINDDLLAELMGSRI